MSRHSWSPAEDHPMDDDGVENVSASDRCNRCGIYRFRVSGYGNFERVYYALFDAPSVGAARMTQSWDRAPECSDGVGRMHSPSVRTTSLRGRRRAHIGCMFHNIETYFNHKGFAASTCNTVASSVNSAARALYMDQTEWVTETWLQAWCDRYGRPVAQSYQSNVRGLMEYTHRVCAHCAG
jgi:hypothetical protein